MATLDYPQAEEILRLLASAVNAARLYPPSSDLPGQALDRFVSRAGELTASSGTMRFLVDPHSFRMGETPVAAAHNQTVTLAETMHAMQIGQLVIAPGMTRQEAAALVKLAGTDPKELRAAGGARSALLAAGANNVAVIEVSLRASHEEGLAGVDLVNAPLEDVAIEAAAAAARWAASVGTGGSADEAAQAVGRLEQATRDLAAARVAEAIMHLSEAERVQLLASALRRDASGQPMKGMLDVIAKMNPAALARLLKMTAHKTGGTPELLIASFELPSETAREVAALLAHSPRTEADCGVPADPHVERMAEDASTPGGEEHIARLKAVSDSTRAGRALAATLAVVREGTDAEGVSALGVALAPAARTGALATVREALRTLDEIAANPALADEAAVARASLTDPEVLSDVCRVVASDSDAAIAGELLSSAGTPGAEVLLEHYSRAGEGLRSLLRPVFRGMSEQVIAVAGRQLRSEDSTVAMRTLSVLPDLGERQVLQVVTDSLEHLDAEVRLSAVTTLANLNGPEARRALAKSLAHWDPETRRWSIREVGRVRAVEAIPALVRILENINIFDRNHELKKEVIKCLESIGSRDAVPVLDRWSKRRFVFGQKNKELRFLARRAVERLAANGHPEEGVDAS